MSATIPTPKRLMRVADAFHDMAWGPPVRPQLLTRVQSRIWEASQPVSPPSPAVLEWKRRQPEIAAQIEETLRLLANRRDELKRLRKGRQTKKTIQQIRDGEAFIDHHDTFLACLKTDTEPLSSGKVLLPGFGITSKSDVPSIPHRLCDCYLLLAVIHDRLRPSPDTRFEPDWARFGEVVLTPSVASVAVAASMHWIALGDAIPSPTTVLAMFDDDVIKRIEQWMRLVAKDLSQHGLLPHDFGGEYPGLRLKLPPPEWSLARTSQQWCRHLGKLLPEYKGQPVNERTLRSWVDKGELIAHPDATRTKASRYSLTLLSLKKKVVDYQD